MHSPERARTLLCQLGDHRRDLVIWAAGGVVTDPWGDPLDVPLDTTTPVVGVGSANPRLAERIGPVLAEVLRSR